MSRILIISLALISFGSYSALPKSPKYDTRITDKNYNLEVSKYGDYRRSLKLSDDILNGNIYKTHEKLNQSFEDLRGLRDKIEPMIIESIPSFLHYRWFNFDVRGPIEVKLSGTAGGAVKLEISKFSLYGKAKAEKSWYLNVYATLRMDNAYAAGEIDLATGKISNLKLRSNFDLDIDSSLNYLIPYFGDKILENLLKKELIESLDDAIIEANGYQTIYGLNNVIPPHKYVHEGVDLGWELQQKMAGLIEGQFIKITMKDIPLLENTRPNLCYEPGPMSWTTPDIVEVNISNDAFLKINKTYVQYCQWNGSGGETDF